MGIDITLHVLEPMSNLFLTVSDQQPRRQVRLRLSDLGWEQVPSDIADWTQVASIDLTSNPLECDCKLLWLKDLLSSIEAEEEAEAVANRCVFMRFCAMMKKSVTTNFS